MFAPNKTSERGYRIVLHFLTSTLRLTTPKNSLPFSLSFSPNRAFCPQKCICIYTFIQTDSGPDVSRGFIYSQVFRTLGKERGKNRGEERERERLPLSSPSNFSAAIARRKVRRQTNVLQLDYNSFLSLFLVPLYISYFLSIYFFASFFHPYITLFMNIYIPRLFMWSNDEMKDKEKEQKKLKDKKKGKILGRKRKKK